ncbi:putative zinc-binding metallopeptidase [Pokkaliibacter sp. CJK22405]|uniref:zinc-binding metallopeptidase family protein n=1 Tax=Pokkaliibacter sp. CJK22405 TaxID=3384615 RepID=UPI00398467EF
MKIFQCQCCGQRLYFENTHCEQCGATLGFIPSRSRLVALAPAEMAGSFHVVDEPQGVAWRFCSNHQQGVCNWLVPESQAEEFCPACALNRTIPDLSVPAHHERWKAIEMAKHRLVYGLIRLGLPLESSLEDHALEFDFLAPDAEAPVMTGHANGLITLNIEEADSASREQMRQQMAEPYRTLLGHLRHEIGHFYWDELLQTEERRDAFRALFGDEREDYGQALNRHYENGTPAGWENTWISAYASAHPWEDWAETWAHYLHMIDTLETAHVFGVSVEPQVADEDESETDIRLDPYRTPEFDELFEDWLPLTFAVNSLNRSMGQPDLYPFVVAPKVLEKLRFIHDLIRETRRARARQELV